MRNRRWSGKTVEGTGLLQGYGHFSQPENHWHEIRTSVQVSGIQTAMHLGTERPGAWFLSPDMVPSDGHKPVSAGNSCDPPTALKIPRNYPVILFLL